MNYYPNMQKNNNIAVYLFIFLCSFIISLFAISSPIFQANIGDSAVFAYVAKIILDGGMPYRDTFDHKGPLIYLINVLGLLIDEHIGIWIVELLTFLIIFIFTYKIARLLKCNRLVSCLLIIVGIVVLLYYFQGGNFTEEYACAFITVSFFYFLKFFSDGHITPCQASVCGKSFASVCLLRVNMIALWIVFVFGILVDLIKNQRIKVDFRFVGWFISGVLLVFIPHFLWLYFNNSFKFFFDDYVIFNFFYISNHGQESLLNVFDAIVCFISTPPVAASIVTLFYFSLKQNEEADWLSIITLSLSIIMESLSGRKYAHYGMIFYPFVMYTASRLLSEYSSVNKEKIEYKKWRLYLGVLSSCFIGAIVFPMMLTPPKASLAYLNDLKDTLTNDNKIAGIIQSITNSNDRISVVGNYNRLYLISNRKSASKYSYQYPIANTNPNIWKEYINEIENLTAKVIILSSDVGAIYPYKEIKKITDTYYRQISVVGNTEIYLLNEAN